MQSRDFNEPQWVLAFRLYSEGKGPKAIFNELKTKFSDDTVHLNTVKNWLGSFRKREGDEEVEKKLEAFKLRFEWHHIGDYGIPWEASEFISRMMVHRMTGPTGSEYLPTVHEVIWWWRIHLIAPSLEDLGRVTGLAFCYMVHEMYALLRKTQIPMDDIYWYLAFRPWDSDERSHAYEAAIAAGEIPRFSWWGKLISPGLLTHEEFDDLVGSQL